MTRRVILALFAACALSTVPALAHPGHDHKILGTVTMAAADHVMVKDKAGNRSEAAVMVFRVVRR